MKSGVSGVGQKSSIPKRHLHETQGVPLKWIIVLWMLQWLHHFCTFLDGRSNELPSTKYIQEVRIFSYQAELLHIVLLLHQQTWKHFLVGYRKTTFCSAEYALDCCLDCRICFQPLNTVQLAWQVYAGITALACAGCFLQGHSLSFIIHFAFRT